MTLGGRASLGFDAFLEGWRQAEELEKGLSTLFDAWGLAPIASPVSRVPGTRRLAFATTGGHDLRVAFNVGTPWSHLTLYPIHALLLESLGGEPRLRALLSDLGEGLRMALGRTYADDMHGAPLEGELHSGLEWLDWYQFWGTSIVDRWGLDHIKGAPFFEIQPARGGACALTLFATLSAPDQIRARRRAAEYLGINLRHPPGDRVVRP